jgi:hypothetical protein
MLRGVPDFKGRVKLAVPLRLPPLGVGPLLLPANCDAPREGPSLKAVQRACQCRALVNFENVAVTAPDSRCLLSFCSCQGIYVDYDPSCLITAEIRRLHQLSEATFKTICASTRNGRAEAAAGATISATRTCTLDCCPVIAYSVIVPDSILET